MEMRELVVIPALEHCAPIAVREIAFVLELSRQRPNAHGLTPETREPAGKSQEGLIAERLFLKSLVSTLHL